MTFVIQEERKSSKVIGNAKPGSEDNHGRSPRHLPPPAQEASFALGQPPTQPHLFPPAIPPALLFGSAHIYRRENLNSLCSITHEQLQHGFQAWPAVSWRDQVSQKHFTFLLNAIIISSVKRSWELAPWLGVANSTVTAELCWTLKPAWLLELHEETAGFDWSFQLKHSHLDMFHCAEILLPIDYIECKRGI